MPLVRTRRSELDLMEIWHYVSKDNPDAADRLLNAIDETCLLLVERPEIGQARPDIGAEIRSFPHRRYLILYRIIPRGVEIVRVVHGARDLRDI